MTLPIIEKAVKNLYPELKNEEISYIGKGTYAKAFKVGTKVFKVTEDADDALISLNVKGKDLQHIVKVYDVFKLHGQESRWGDQLYLIVSEYVPYPITNTKDFNFKYKELNGEWSTYVHGAMQKLFMNDDNDMEVQDVKAVNVSNVTLNPVLIDELYTFAQELKDNGFTNADIHNDNVRVGEDGKFKLIDLGHRTSLGVDVSTVKFEELV